MSELSLFLTYIKRSLHKRPLIYTLIFLMETVSIVCVLFVFGLIYRAYTVFEESDRDERTIVAAFENQNAVDLEEQLAGCIDGATFSAGANSVFDKIENKYESYIAYGLLEYNGDLHKFNVNRSDSTSAKPGEVIVDNERIGESFSVGDKITIGDNEYTVYQNDIQTTSDFVFCSIDDVPKDCLIREFLFILDTQPTYTQAEEIVVLMNEVFDTPTEISIPETLELLDEQLNSMQMLVSLIMILFAVFNCSLCYKYLYSTSRETMRVLRICGATKGYCNVLYISEIAIHILLCFGVAYLLFDGLILQSAINAYSGIELAYNKSNYMFILLSYIIISVVIAFVCVLPSAVSGQIAKRQQ